MKQRIAYRWIIVTCIIASAICIVALRDAVASGDDIEIETGAVELVGGDVSHSSRALGLGRSSFDVDINDCRESTSWDTVLVGKQGVRLNPWCAAEVYEAKGLFHMAALMRCDIPEVAKHFSTADECVIANTVTHAVTHAPAPPEVDEDEDERDEMLERQQTIIDVQQTELVAVTERLDRLERRRTQSRPVTNQVGLTDEQRTALAEVFDK